jgi:endoglucanase
MKFSLFESPLHRLISVGCAILAGCLIVSTGSAQTAASAGTDAFARNKSLGRGVNVLGYDPIWDSFDQARFKQRYFKMIRDGGFETLRVNLHPFRHMGAAPDFALNNAWWRTADWIVTNALAANLNVILDLHEFTITAEDAAGNKARILAFWRQVAAHYKNAPDRVLFEILNEPNGKLTPELWNRYLAEALAVIRETNPHRTVVIGPAFWNAIDHLAELKLPEADRNLIVTVHHYKPMAFTHQGTEWSHPPYKVGAVWEGTPEERAAIEKDFNMARDWAKQNHRPIFLGEFGAYEKGEMPSRVRWTDFIARAAETNGWSWAYWQFDSDFVVYDIAREQWVEPIYRALIPPAVAKKPQAK